ncbi:MAG: helix-turn-helix domain-containing protein [Acidimicrobiales bacterium]
MEGLLQVVVGANLRRLRSDLGFSQEAFGDHIGWHRTFVGAVERGERNLTMRTIERLSTELGVHPLELLYDRDGVAIVRADDGGPQFVDRSEPQRATGKPSRGAPRKRPG